MRRNHSTATQTSITRFALGQTFITAGAEEALQIAGQTAIEFLPRHRMRRDVLAVVPLRHAKGKI